MGASLRLRRGKAASCRMESRRKKNRAGGKRGPVPSFRFVASRQKTYLLLRCARMTIRTWPQTPAFFFYCKCLPNFNSQFCNLTHRALAISNLLYTSASLPNFQVLSAQVWNHLPGCKSFARAPGCFGRGLWVCQIPSMVRVCSLVHFLGLGHFSVSLP